MSQCDRSDLLTGNFNQKLSSTCGAFPMDDFFVYLKVFKVCIFAFWHF